MTKKLIITLLCLILTLSLCMVNAKLINPTQINVRKQTIYSDKINNNEDIIIAYFSDLHYGEFLNEEYLNKLVNHINSYDPDIVLFGGDLIEENLNIVRIEALTNYLKNINSEFGKYYVLGEDDRYNTNDILQNAGFILLDNNCISIDTINNTLNIIGINSLKPNYDAFNDVDNNYSLVISHYPDIFKNIENKKFDYMLAGHSHGGQIFIPLFNRLYREDGCKEYYKGKYHNNDKTLDISNGVGMKNTNIRFISDNEILIYKLTSNIDTKQ